LIRELFSLMQELFSLMRELFSLIPELFSLIQELFLELVEAHTARHAARLDQTVDAARVELLHASAVDITHLDHGREVPDVIERNLGEQAAPFGGDEDTTKQS